MLRLGGPGSRPGVWALTWATLLPPFRTYPSMISGGGMEGHLNTFPRGGLPCIPSNGAAFGIPTYDGCEAPPPLPVPLEIHPLVLLPLALVRLDCYSLAPNPIINPTYTHFNRQAR